MVPMVNQFALADLVSRSSAELRWDSAETVLVRAIERELDTIPMAVDVELDLDAWEDA